MRKNLYAYCFLFLPFRFSLSAALCSSVFLGFLGLPALTSAQTLTINASSATACSGATVTLTAVGCPANGSLRWSTNQVGAVVSVAPVQTTAYVASCNVTTTTPVTSTATSSTATSSTAVITTVTTTTAAATIQVNPAIVATPTITNATCYGNSDGSVTINATGGAGGLQYQFNGQGFQQVTSFARLAAGMYPIVVRDARGCTSQLNIEIKQSPPLSLSITSVGAKCVGGADGGLIAVASGGAGEYKYYINNTNPRDNGTFLDLQANTSYLISITDKQGCVTGQTVLIGAPNPFTITTTPTLTRCAGSADGIVSVAVTGGSGGYKYQLGSQAFQTGTQFTGLAANTYEITVQDANGCLGKKSVVVDQPAPLRLATATLPVNCFGPNSGAITATPSGGTGTVMYQLTAAKAPQSSNTFTGVAVGDYTLIGTDANGCTSFTSVTVGKADALKAQAVPMPASCCICPNGAVRLASTGGTGTRRQYQVIGQALQAENQINGLRPNTYALRVTDEVGCADTITAVVTDAQALTLSAGTIKNVSCTGGSNGEATIQVAGGTKPFTYYWLTERSDTLKARTATQTGLIEGTYTVSVLDSNRCTTSTAFVTIKAQNPVPFKPAVSQSGSTLVVNQSAGIQWYVRTGTDPGKAVPDATQPTLVPFQSGQYYVIITTNGCSSPPSDAVSFVLTATVEPGSGLSIRVAPNPVTDRLRLEIEQPERSSVQLQLLDASGRAVWQNQLPAFTGEKQAEWAIQGLSKGTYLLKAESGSRRSVLRVLVE